ncbi:hypothetical protein I4U23_012616 [Adineta vaga]|nr:hypothetical protein I4U23_012616 [Adineta vaga]
MASFIRKTLYILLVFFVITQFITAYRVPEDSDIEEQTTIDADLSEINHNDIRSVLWPKICYPSLKRRNNYPTAAGGRSIQFIKRSARKCNAYFK